MAVQAPVVSTQLNLDQIQGNISGFQKDFQCFLFLRFPSRDPARAWLHDITGEIATAQEVLDFNNLFKRVKSRRGGREGGVKATWVNIGLTYSGLATLGAPDLDQFPDDFKAGMRNRTHFTGDVDDSAPANWVFPVGGGDIHAVLLIAADSQSDLDAEVGRLITELTARGIQLLFKQDGMSRRDQPGHEHFGFDDGVSQPGLRDDRISSPDPDVRQPGQDRICPGDFVIGYPTQPNSAPAAGQDEAECGPVSTPSPAWTQDGTFLVFRRLRQDVKGFREFVRETAPTITTVASGEQMSEDLLGAKMVGRYRSGAPLEPLTNPIAGVPIAGLADPVRDHPEILDDRHINDFNYKDNDPDGLIVPRAAHIRKVYPRDEEPPGEAFAETRRILRRGIAYGLSFREDVDPGTPQAGDATFPNDRGLLFLCYQSSISDKFEFLMQAWVNNPNFPSANDGHDPIIAQKDATRRLTLPGGQPDHLALMQRWVITTGGDYFFSPSIDTLALLASGGGA